uniref:Ribosomal protein L6 n=1 Tax=Cyanoptyche gloeocystis TaxID=77922 RepID=A0A096Y6X9_9EUKA|nr:ribosomal protein L6 [Cyanoptyche gloeocystis]AIM52077.1 ribosomal protein L6 [Cyanoptyche gloeocystis]
MILKKNQNIMLYKYSRAIIVKNIKKKYQIIKIIQQIKSLSTIKLKLTGVGFKVRNFLLNNCNKHFLQLFLGKSHKIFIVIPKDITLQSKKNVIKLSCYNLQTLNLFVVYLKSQYKKNSFNNKGIFLFGENKLIKKTNKKK